MNIDYIYRFCGISLLLLCIPTLLKAQVDTKFFTKTHERDIENIFVSKKSIDYIRLAVVNNNITAIYVKDKNDSSYFNWKKETVQYVLSYAGDKFKLQHEIPSLYNLLFTSAFTNNIRSSGVSTPLEIVLKPTGIDISTLNISNSGTKPSPEMRETCRVELTEKLNNDNHDKNIQTNINGKSKRPISNIEASQKKV